MPSVERDVSRRGQLLLVLGFAHGAQGRQKLAEPFLQRAYDDHAIARGAAHFAARDVARQIAAYYHAHGEAAEAERFSQLAARR